MYQNYHETPQQKVVLASETKEQEDKDVLS